MRSSAKLLGWAASAALAFQFTGNTGYGQQYSYAPYPERSAWATSQAGPHAYAAESSWASVASNPYRSTAANYVAAQCADPGYTMPVATQYGAVSAGCADSYQVCGTLCDSRCGWFGGVGALVMDRDRDNFFAFSYDTNDESIQLVNNRDAEMDLAGGVEARLGRYFCCGSSSLEFVFWTIIPGTQDYQLLGANVVGDLNAIHNWDDLTYNGNPGNTYVDNAVVHRLRREHEFQNYELNWNTYLTPQSCGAFQVQTIAGLRYFRFGETFDFGADTVNATFTGEDDEIHYLIDVDNRLFGFQLGGRSEYALSQRFSVTAKVLGGIYANDVSHHSRIGGAAGDAVVNNGPNNGEAFNIASDKTDIAMMGELELGMLYRFGGNWQIGAGYRAMGISGVALATNQVYADLRGLEDVQWVDVNGDLILHGGYLQLLYNY